MDFGAVFSAIIALINFIPTVKGWVDSFIAFYVERQLASMRRENSDAIRKAIENHDQRPLEEALGNPTAGQPSGLPGVIIRDSIPGMSDPKGSAGKGVVK